jgi:hypothetical protein
MRGSTASGEARRDRTYFSATTLGFVADVMARAGSHDRTMHPLDRHDRHVYERNSRPASTARSVSDFPYELSSFLRTD